MPLAGELMPRRSIDTPPTRPSRVLLFGCGLAIVLNPARARADDPRAGEAIYREHCAACHGEGGQGVADEYAKPLVGARSRDQLARYVDRRMPEGEPDLLDAEESRRVAEYVYDAFYSPAAQERLRPARIELARLTVRQYQNAVADLIGGFRDPADRGDERGLHATYYKSGRMRGKDKALDRVDPQVRFDFGKGAPEVEGIEPREFSIRWEGSVIAPETGDYEFNARSLNSVRLWVNQPENEPPLIDGWVQSGTDADHRGSIRLIGGRAYPIRLEFAKTSQGVKDKVDKEKAEQAPALIELAWKPPLGVEATIPTRNLVARELPMVFVLNAPFPPDDRSVGYERGTSISTAWDEATTEAALEVAGSVAERLDELAGTRDAGDQRPAKLREFARRFVERAFRRPLTDDQARLYVDRQFDAVSDLDAAVKRTVILALKSPRFLYREVGGSGHDAHDRASRLAFTLWDSIPDAELLKVAESGGLDGREAIAAQARRMLDDPRAHAKLRGFMLRWLKVDHGPDLSKDPELFPGFDATVAADLRTSLDLFLEDVLWGDQPDFRRLFLADQVDLNGRLAPFYGVELPADAPFQKVTLDPGHRAGVLTHPYLLSSLAYTATSSPIHRGVFLARGVLGRALRPPPEAFTPLPADLHPGLSTRERVTLQTRPESCISCHGLINPLGFTLERFDAIGRLRNEEQGEPIDTTGGYEPPDGEPVAMDGARQLAEFLAGSDEVHSAFVEHLFHNLVQQPIRAFGPNAEPELRAAFVTTGFDLRKLVVEIATLAAETPPPEALAASGPKAGPAEGR